ncbi:MAG: hypothetical protein ACRCYT_01215, partial [Cetobacterium sp.]
RAIITPYHNKEEFKMQLVDCCFNCKYHKRPTGMCLEYEYAVMPNMICPDHEKRIEPRPQLLTDHEPIKRAYQALHEKLSTTEIPMGSYSNRVATKTQYEGVPHLRIAIASARDVWHEVEFDIQGFVNMVIPYTRAYIEEPWGFKRDEYGEIILEKCEQLVMDKSCSEIMKWIRMRE